MELIAYTAPGYTTDEYEKIQQLFQSGLQQLHVYKPGYDAAAMNSWLDKLGTDYWNRIILHLYDEWITAAVAGYHLSRGFLLRHSLGDIANHIFHGQSISVTTHHPIDWTEWKDRVHEVVISPVFDSISKPGHMPVHALKEWQEVFKNQPGSAKKIALGGITPEKVKDILLAGFDAVAVSGWLWEESADTVNRFELMKVSVESTSHVYR